MGKMKDAKQGFTLMKGRRFHDPAMLPTSPTPGTARAETPGLAWIAG